MGNKISNTFRRGWVLGITGAAIFGGVLAMLYAFSLGPDGKSSFENVGAAQPRSTVHTVEVSDLNGAYEGESEGVTIRASVENKSIVVTMTNEGVTITYWRGSFDSTARPGTNIASVKDNTQALLVQSDTKVFTVGDGALSYTMTMMGVSRQIDLRHV